MMGLLAKGFKAWHGSPYVFKTFRRATGMGEGTVGGQVGGRTYEGAGTYLTDRRGVAKRYWNPRFPKNLPQSFEKWPSVYKVEVGSDPAHFIDLHLSVDRQSPYIQERLASLGIKSGTGQQALARMGAFQRETGQEVANRLHSIGIAGTRFPTSWADAGTRAKDMNYVVFDPRDLKILERQGALVHPDTVAGMAKAAAIGGGAAAVATGLSADHKRQMQDEINSWRVRR